MHDSTTADYLIIGAGVAGMAAAEHLRAAGARVMIVDKAARPGGRCATRRIDKAADAPWFDYGAQYFTARSDGFSELVEQDLAAGRLTTWSPMTASAEKTGPTWLLMPSPDERQRLIGPRGLNQWVRERLAAHDIAPACSTRISTLVPTTDGWQASTDDGQTLHARSVILTVPAVQARDLLGAQAAGIGPLAAADQALSACHSLVVQAPALADAQAIFIKDGKLSWAADNTHKAKATANHSPTNPQDSRHLWTLHANPEYSDETVETPTAELADSLIAEFAALTGQRAADMTLVRAHRWRYARPGPAAPDGDTLCWCDAENGLALAGDWLAGGRVEGAWQSGRAAAQRLLA